MRLALPFVLCTVAASLIACAHTPQEATPSDTPAAETQATPATAPTNPEDLQKAETILDAVLASAEANEANEALVALGMSQREDARAKLATGLKSRDGKVRFAAARGLRYLGDPSVAELLADAWMKEKGWAVRKELAIAAGATGAKDLVPLLTEALTHDNGNLVHAAAWALEALGEAEGTKKLDALGRPEPTWEMKKGSDRWARRVLQGDTDGDKALAVRILAELGTKEDVPLAVMQLDDEAPLVRVFAAALVLRHR